MEKWVSELSFQKIFQFNLIKGAYATIKQTLLKIQTCNFDLKERTNNTWVNTYNK